VPRSLSLVAARFSRRERVSPLRREKIRHIGVFLQNRRTFGTLVCHIPFLSSLRRYFPAARVTIISPFAGAQLLVDEGLADELRIWPPQPRQQYRLFRTLDADMLLTLRPVSIFIDLLVGLSRARVRSGYRTAVSRFLFSSTSPRDLAIYRPLNYLRVLDGLGIQHSLTGYFEEAARRASVVFDPRDELYCFMPGGDGPHKRWGIDNFIALAERIRGARPAARFVFIVGPKEADLPRDIRASATASASVLLETPALATIAHAVLASRVTIANDCGPSHVAQLLGRPYVGLFANDRGQADRLVREWFFARPGACWVSPSVGADINEISPDIVYGRMLSVLPSAAADFP
jgi:ADP-heptose:LPS heptosyltransferase